jgi:hypothetical protein
MKVHPLRAVVEMDGRFYDVALTVREDVNGKLFYDLGAIDFDKKRKSPDGQSARPDATDAHRGDESAETRLSPASGREGTSGVADFTDGPTVNAVEAEVKQRYAVSSEEEARAEKARRFSAEDYKADKLFEEYSSLQEEMIAAIEAAPKGKKKIEKEYAARLKKAFAAYGEARQRANAVYNELVSELEKAWGEGTTSRPDWKEFLKAELDRYATLGTMEQGVRFRNARLHDSAFMELDGYFGENVGTPGEVVAAMREWKAADPEGFAEYLRQAETEPVYGPEETALARLADGKADSDAGAVNLEVRDVTPDWTPEPPERQAMPPTPEERALADKALDAEADRLMREGAATPEDAAPLERHIAEMEAVNREEDAALSVLECIVNTTE